MDKYADQNAVARNAETPLW